MFRVLCMLAAAACAVAPAAALTSVYSSEEFSRVYPLSARGCIFVENLNGDVRISTWDREEVRVQAVKRATSPEHLGDAHIVVDTGAGKLSIRTHYAYGTEEPASVEYRITVPRRATLGDVKLTNGGLSIVGVAGDVRASAVNGSIHAEQLEGETELSTVNGQLEAGFNRLAASRPISLSSVNGPITLLLPSDARASVVASNLSGGIRNDFGPAAAAARGHRLRTVIQGGGTRIRLRNINGGISINRHNKRT